MKRVSPLSSYTRLSGCETGYSYVSYNMDMSNLVRLTVLQRGHVFRVTRGHVFHKIAYIMSCEEGTRRQKSSDTEVRVPVRQSKESSRQSF